MEKIKSNVTFEEIANNCIEQKDLSDFFIKNSYTILFSLLSKQLTEKL